MFKLGSKDKTKYKNRSLGITGNCPATDPSLDTDAIVFEGSDDRWFTNASENIASLGGLWPELVEQVETAVSEFRGVYSPKYERKVIFSETITFKTSDLPRWKPNL